MHLFLFLSNNVNPSFSSLCVAGSDRTKWVTDRQKNEDSIFALSASHMDAENIRLQNEINILVGFSILRRGMI